MVRVFIMFAAGLDSDAKSGHDMDSEHGDMSASDLAFKALSLQGISGFVMMFGIVGLAADLSLAKFGAERASIASFIAAMVAGCITVWLIKIIFKWADRLQSSGTLKYESGIGQTGTVYLSVAKEKPGKIQVNVQGRLITADAITRSEERIATGEHI
ncbi:MAG: hypothetical protein IT292_08060 [Deltaproteobacteria bacterium]|nr:hypothetical protein [Deltaproteobacteria bacterium]